MDFDCCNYEADGWIKDTAHKVGHSVKNFVKSAPVKTFVKGVSSHGSKVIKKTLLEAGKDILAGKRMSRVVAEAIAELGKQGIQIGKEEAEKMIIGEYNKETGNGFSSKAEFLGYAGALQRHMSHPDYRQHTMNNYKGKSQHKPQVKPQTDKPIDGSYGTLDNAYGPEKHIDVNRISLNKENGDSNYVEGFESEDVAKQYNLQKRGLGAEGPSDTAVKPTKNSKSHSNYNFDDLDQYF
jgi:hypothetical protein